jgi:hypothetical protein
MCPTLPLQWHGEIKGLPPTASSVSSPQHSLHRRSPVLDTDAADVVLCMLPTAVAQATVPAGSSCYCWSCTETAASDVYFERELMKVTKHSFGELHTTHAVVV